jgi:N-acetylneuraminate synthase
MKRVTIAHKTVGKGSPVFIIAEAGCNHNGDSTLAKELVDVAAEAGADAVKFQTFITEEIVTSSAEKADYQKHKTGNGNETQRAMLKKLELSFDSFRELKLHCDHRRILFLSTPYDSKSVDFLHGLDVPAFKIASGDITNLPLLSYVASKGKPIIISTGMSTEEEVEEALRVIQETPQPPAVMLLHCTSAYPARPEDANLRAMNTLYHRFRVPVGLSDHTLGIEIPLAAVALGARIIEKHFTLDKSSPGPDHSVSLEPHELRRLVQSIRVVKKALGNGIKAPAESEKSIMDSARKSIVAATNIKKGEYFSEHNLTVKRPGTGMSPTRWNDVLGRRAERNFNADELIE